MACRGLRSIIFNAHLFARARLSFTSSLDQLIQQLDLQPHPEGGYYRETYRAAQSVVQNASLQPRSASTAIYYLLSGKAYSAWHRIKSDEIWHFYAGAPIDIHVLDEAGALLTHRLGNALDYPGSVFQAMVPAGHWFAAERIDPDSYALVGCTVAPGFEFSEFELGDPQVMLRDWPQHRGLIQRLSA